MQSMGKPVLIPSTPAREPRYWGVMENHFPSFSIQSAREFYVFIDSFQPRRRTLPRLASSFQLEFLVPRRRWLSWRARRRR